MGGLEKAKNTLTYYKNGPLLLSKHARLLGTSEYWIREYRRSLSLGILRISYLPETQKIKIRIIFSM